MLEQAAYHAVTG